MANVIPRVSPAQLAARLAGLALQIDALRVERRAVALPDYAGGPRPSSVVHVSGAGVTGCGENVAFSDAEHDRFESSVAAWFQEQRGRTGLRVENAVQMTGTRYERAALEAALVDLGLRQAALCLHDLTGVRAVRLRFVVSLAAAADPLRQIAELRAGGHRGDLKLDVDPSWHHATLRALAAEPSIVIFDFKGRGTPALAERLATLNQHALFEDPPSGFEPAPGSHAAARISRDASLLDARAVESARARAEAVNLKAPRMGGPLELLRGLERALAPRASGPATAEARPASVYIGGMFEVAVGRSQARQLAALYCAEGPNDLAPNLATVSNGVREGSPVLARVPNGVREVSPVLVRLDEPGFGTAHAPS